MHFANCCRTENTSIPFALVRYVIGYSQLSYPTHAHGTFVKYTYRHR